MCDGSGWLAMDGKFTPVECGLHDHYCEVVLDKTTSEVEKIHVRISVEPDGETFMLTCQKRLTSAQERALLDVELDPDEVKMF